MIPTLFCFIVEGVGSVDIYAESYGSAVSLLEKKVGFNVYGKFILEREIRHGFGEYRRFAD